MFSDFEFVSWDLAFGGQHYINARVAKGPTLLIYYIKDDISTFWSEKTDGKNQPVALITAPL